MKPLRCLLGWHRWTTFVGMRRTYSVCGLCRKRSEQRITARELLERR